MLIFHSIKYLCLANGIAKSNIYRLLSQKFVAWRVETKKRTLENCFTKRAFSVSKNFQNKPSNYAFFRKTEGFMLINLMLIKKECTPIVCVKTIHCMWKCRVWLIPLQLIMNINTIREIETENTTELLFSIFPSNTLMLKFCTASLFGFV